MCCSTITKLKEIMETPAQEALRLISPLKESEFIAGYFTNDKDKCCLVGHLNRLTSENPKDYTQGNCNAHFRYTKLVGELFTASKMFGDSKTFIAKVSNGQVPDKYPQKTFKGRCTRLFKDMIKAGL